ncbi:small ribosomal subunit protein mS31-like [Diadema antillarum]|uniref:small ribosomal subunit protein mS31-like n=1 Tax=Diadema antillarum TaxID=105358 RepID=UPI003A8B991E
MSNMHGYIIRSAMLPRLSHSPALWRLDVLRTIQTAARRQAEEDAGDGESIKPVPSKKKVAATSASNLLDMLAGLRVQKKEGSDSDSEARAAEKQKVSAAANFQRMVSRAQRRREKESQKDDTGGETEIQKSPGLQELQELTAEAAKTVAEVYPDRELVESELLKELRRHDEATAAGERGETGNISSVLSGFRVQKQTVLEKHRSGRDLPQGGSQRAGSAQFDAAFSHRDPRRAAEEDTEDGERRMGRMEPHQRQQKRSLFDRQRLNIFTAASELDRAVETASETSIWEVEQQKQLKALYYSTVRNGFEEAMKLTEEGKLWKYPIDNEQGLEEERKVGFHEHVFLDHLLQDFPQRAQVLDFMELVLIGLGKNPFLTVAQKHDHVVWFRDYFWKKEEVFDRLDAADKEKANI